MVRVMGKMERMSEKLVVGGRASGAWITRSRVRGSRKLESEMEIPQSLENAIHTGMTT